MYYNAPWVPFCTNARAAWNRSGYDKGHVEDILSFFYVSITNSDALNPTKKKTRSRFAASNSD